MIFYDLYKHQKLANKRHPMFEKNKFGKFFMYFMALFWLAYLLFIGIMLGLAIPEATPNMEGYHTFNQYALPIILGIDFLLRFIFQIPPSQEIKSYLLFPIKVRKLIHFLLSKSLLSPFNILWWFLILPFSLFTIPNLHGFTGIFYFLIGFWLLALFNNYWYLLCRTLIEEKFLYILLPITIYGLLVGSELLFNHSITTFFMNFGEQLIFGNLIIFLAIIASIFIMWLFNFFLIKKVMYKELSKQEDTTVKHVSEYRFLDKFGEIGEFIRLEIKLLTRNKNPRNLLFIGCALIIFMELMLFTDAYKGAFGKDFVCTYNFVLLGMFFLTRIMSYEGNYIDGLMSRKESIYTLLRSKYYFYTLVSFIPYLLMIPSVVLGKITLLKATSCLFFAIGFTNFVLFQLAVYNYQKMPLNEKIMGKNSSGNWFQSLLSFFAIGFPLIFNSILRSFFGEIIAEISVLSIGLILVLTSNLWIKNIYHRFMKRRYTNMEKFRNA